MQTFLTLVIALGGIATGIGAIWAALAARRQAQVSERQAQLTEHSLAEQRQFLKEQNERARLNLEVDLLNRLEDRYGNQTFLSRRRALAKHYLDNGFVDGALVGVERFHEAAMDVCDFFEDLAYWQRLGALTVESVWNTFGGHVRIHWALCKPAIEKMREEYKDPALYVYFEYLSRLMADMDDERGVPAGTPEQVRQNLEAEVARGEKPTTAPE